MLEGTNDLWISNLSFLFVLYEIEINKLVSLWICMLEMLIRIM
ncbi:hypothetical protein BC03BB108_D0003 (plasmid) [Bacillus cereus 03BB108]|nr:hypothetical protein BC03BB108_D0003 [Bacillus cereus 03BB108]